MTLVFQGHRTFSNELIHGIVFILWRKKLYYREKQELRATGNSNNKETQDLLGESPQTEQGHSLAGRDGGQLKGCLLASFMGQGELVLILPKKWATPKSRHASLFGHGVQTTLMLPMFISDMQNVQFIKCHLIEHDTNSVCKRR